MCYYFQHRLVRYSIEASTIESYKELWVLYQTKHLSTTLGFWYMTP